MTYFTDVDLEQRQLEAQAAAAAAVRGGNDTLSPEERDYVINSAARHAWYGESLYEGTSLGVEDVAAIRAPRTASGALNPYSPPVIISDEEFDELFFAASDLLRRWEEQEDQ